MSETEVLSQNKIPSAYLKGMKEAASSPGAHLDNAQKKPEWDFHADSGRWDAAESFFVARQLEFMRPGIYAVQYPALKAQRMIPFNMGIDPGAVQFTATIVDQVGEVKVLRNLAGDIPKVELKTSQASTNMFDLVLGYDYSIAEAQAAMYAKVPLIPQKALRTREQMERKLDDIAFLGDAQTGMVGLLSSTATDTYTVPSTGSGNTKTWSTKSADDVLLDLNGPINQVIVNTNEVEIPDAMILPLAAKTLIANRRVGDGTSTTILTYFLLNQEFCKTVEGTYKANTAGSGGTRGCVYVKDPTRLEMLVSLPFTQLPPQARDFMVTTLCRMRTGGMAIYLPSSVCKFDGI